MAIAATANLAPVVAHSIPGRLRLKTENHSPSALDAIVRRLTARAGVRSVRGEPLTGSVVVQYDARVVEEPQILALAAADVFEDDVDDAPPPAAQAVQHEHHSHSVIYEGITRRGAKVVRRVRVSVRGLDRNSVVARRVVERLTSRPGVHAQASALTGRVLIEFDEELSELRELLGDISDVELPALPGEDNPTHPLDPVPITQSSVRVGGAAIGLGLLATRRLIGSEGATLENPAWGYVSGAFNIAQSIPWVRRGMRHLIGKNAGDLTLGMPDIALSALIGSPLSLLVNGVGALRLLMTASARRQSWRNYEERLGDASPVESGATIRLDSGEITPMPSLVIDGSGTAIDSEGLAYHFTVGAELPAGARLRGTGPFVLELQDAPAFEPKPRSADPTPTLTDRYHEWNAPISAIFATVLGIATRSPGRAFEAMLCLSPRAATAGTDAAHLNATARVIRGGSVVVGTRPNRRIELPNTVIVESARILTEGLEVAEIRVMDPGTVPGEALRIAAQVSHACGSPWGDTFGAAPLAAPGVFEHGCARVTLDGVEYRLEHEQDQSGHRARGHLGFVLSRIVRGAERPVAHFSVRPRLSPALEGFIEICRINKVDLIMLAAGERDVARDVASRAGVVTSRVKAVDLIAKLQEEGRRVCYISDGAHGGEAFAQCDLAIGLTSGRRGRFAARADILSPDLAAVAAVIEAGAITARCKRDSVGFSLLANVVGAYLCLQGATGIVAASRAVYVATLAAYASAAVRFRGGDRLGGYTDRYADPRPEQRWGKRRIADVMVELGSTQDGLTQDEAERRLQAQNFAERPRHVGDHAFLKAVGAQLRSPLIGLMAAGAALTFAVGTPVEFGLVALTIGANILFGAWQEQQVQGASKALAGIAPSMAMAIRDGLSVSIPTRDLVPGDVILLGSGDRIPADARILEAESLEVDEASLTGESLPVPKSAHAASEFGRILLEGSDVIVGRAKAIVVAVGRKSRMGSIAAAISQEERSASPLNTRLAKLLQQFLPIAAAAGGVVFVAGLLQGRHWMPELVLATTLALSAIPEGLPLLAGVAEVAVSSRLSKRGAYLRRLGAAEALGRVDVACTDKTGTLTQGRLALSLVATPERVALLDSAGDPPEVSDAVRAIVLAAALASPHPEATDVRAHPTDMAVLEGAARLGVAADAPRDEEAPFEPTRSFHASRVGGRVVVKGAPEEVVARCTRVRLEDGDVPVNEFDREALLREAERIAGRGMRVLMVAEGGDSSSVDDPQYLTALGFLGIRDPLKPSAKEAMAKCQRAGVRVIIVTGDHPATARAIAVEAGLEATDENVLTGTELAVMDNAQLDARMRDVTVVARVAPLDKLRIIESLRRMGHVVAMTGDGVNDAPALRLSDVGIAMGRGGTEVARQAADVVLADDDFTTLVEALVEGRGFWRNIRRALGLLLGGIIGELGFMAIATAIGLPAPLNTRQILAMNLITFGLPTLAVALQEPEHRNLAGLAREGATSLEKPLRRDVFRRAGGTILPSLAAYFLALPFGPAQAQTVAFGAAIGSQLAQTVDSGQVETGLTKSVVGAVGTSLALMLASVLVPQGRALLTLAIPSLPAWGLILIASCCAPLVARGLGAVSRPVERSRLVAGLSAR